MSLVQFLTATGAFTWGWIAWRAYKLTRGLPNRIRWALWSHKRAKVVRRYR